MNEAGAIFRRLVEERLRFVGDLLVRWPGKCRRT
jgi:hypothetical protein